MKIVLKSFFESFFEKELFLESKKLWERKEAFVKTWQVLKWRAFLIDFEAFWKLSGVKSFLRTFDLGKLFDLSWFLKALRWLSRIKSFLKFSFETENKPKRFLKIELLKVFSSFLKLSAAFQLNEIIVFRWKLQIFKVQETFLQKVLSTPKKTSNDVNEHSRILMIHEIMQDLVKSLTPTKVLSLRSRYYLCLSSWKLNKIN